MAYGTIKVDTITFTDGGVDKSVSVSGLVENPTFTGNVTATDTISGDILRGQTISGVTVTGTTANFTSGNFINISGGTHTITSGVFASGTAANPSISFVLDPNSGLYSPGADQVAISTNGTGRLFVDASGRILAGASSARVNFFNTTSLSASLQIEGVTSSSHYVSFISSNSTGNEPACLILGHQKSGSIGGNTLLGSGDATGRISFQGSDGAQFVEAAAISCDIDGTPSGDDMPGRLVFATTADGAASPTERMRLDSSGRLGVGSSSPATQFSVQNASTSLGIETDTTSGFATGPTIRGYYRAGSAYTTLGLTGSAVAFGINDVEKMRLTSTGLGVGTTPDSRLHVLDGSGNGLRIGYNPGTNNYNIYDAAEHLFRNNGGSTERARIDSSGRLGLGTSSPSRLLELSGATNPGIKITNSSTDSGSIVYETAANALNISADNDSSGTYRSLRIRGSSISLQTTSTTSLSTAVTIDSSQRVGIGTTTPGNTLHVNGTSRFEDYIYGSTVNGKVYVIDDLAVSATKKIYFDNGSNTYIHEPSGDNLAVVTGGTERARIDTSGRLLVGTSSARTNFLTGLASARVQIENAGEGTAEISAVRNVTSSSGGLLIFGKSRSSAIGSVTTVINGDQMGWISFQGADGTNFIEGAAIRGEVDGTPGANDMPGRIVLSTTAAGASSPTERVRINSNGRFSVYSSDNILSTFYSTKAAGTSDYIFAGGHSATAIGSATNSYFVYTNGNVQNTNGSYTTISDVKLKENIVDAGSQWDDFKAIQIRNWNFKAETGHETHRQIGPIAQELETVCPGLVFETPDRDPEGNDLGTTTKGVNQSILYMKAVKALQEAMERIETLEAKVAALESA